MDALCLLLCVTQLLTLLITVFVRAALYEDDGPDADTAIMRFSSLFYTGCSEFTFLLAAVTCMPVFLNEVLINEMNDNGVYYSLDQIYNALNDDTYRKSPGIASMKNMYEASDKRWNRTFMELVKTRGLIRYKPFIVIEGLASHMRKKVSRLVAEKMRAKFLTAPFRHGIDGILDDKDVRRAYYSLSKYTMANFAKVTRILQPVIAERYWLDHAVYVIAKVYEEELPSENAIIYKWPEDLMKPDYLFLLNDLNTTYGKALSEKQFKFVEREINVYRMFKDPNIIEIPLDVHHEKVAETILNYVICM